MEYIYVLKCQKDKFYIGKTYNVQIEYNDHLDKKFEFTKNFKQSDIDIDSIFENSDLELIISKYIIKYDVYFRFHFYFFYFQQQNFF